MWRQQWGPAPRDERPLRWFAGSVSALWHLGLTAFLLWVMYLELHEAAKPPPKGEEDVVQIEFIGEGTPAEVGGGPDAERASAAQDPAPSQSRAAARTQPLSSAAVAEPEPAPPFDNDPAEARPLPALSRPEPVVTEPVLALPDVRLVEREIPDPVPPSQAVAVTEPVESVQEFVLPPPTPRAARPEVAMPELAPAQRSPELIELPPPLREVRPGRPQANVEQPVLQPRLPQVPTRDVPMPANDQAPSLPAPTVPRPTLATPELAATTSPMRIRDIPAPPASTAAPSGAPTQSPTQVREQDVLAGQAPTASSSQAPAGAPTTVGAGPKPVPQAGGWPDPARATDTGASDRQRPGGQRGQPPGVFNSDGSVRLAEPGGSASPGVPPGTVTEEIANIDRAGTWLKRRPTDYEPTTLDQYWRPNESLLEEWVRRSVSTIRIPIPGTSKTIVCQTVLLMLGGGCGISDANLHDQPASARPPPDVPFKPELQEGTGTAPPRAGS